MLREMTAVQLEEWLAFSELEVLPTDREKYLFASVVQVIANSNLRKGRPNFKLDELLVKFGDEHHKKPMTWQELKTLAKRMTEDSIRQAKRGR